MIHGHELKRGNVGGRGCAGRRGIKQGKWDNWNSIINKIHFEKSQEERKCHSKIFSVQNKKGKCKGQRADGANGRHINMVDWNPTAPVITLKVNGPNASRERQRMSNWLQEQDPTTRRSRSTRTTEGGSKGLGKSYSLGTLIERKLRSLWPPTTAGQRALPEIKRDTAWWKTVNSSGDIIILTASH